MFIFLGLTIICSTIAEEDLSSEDIAHKFIDWKSTWGKNYNGDVDEKVRADIFELNYRRMLQFNKETDKGRHSYRLGVNRYSDMNVGEMVRQLNGFRSQIKSQVTGDVYSDVIPDVPDSMDWRTRGAVTSVRGQLLCASDWAFSVVATVEAQHALKTKKLVELSEQNLIDCSTTEYNLGCKGGRIYAGFKWIIKNNGINTLEQYPYVGKNQNCTFNTTGIVAKVKEFKNVAPRNEEALKSAVAKFGPVAAAIDASSFHFQLYSSGIYNDTKCKSSITALDHAVTIVGYGTENKHDYWIVKNSYGYKWGENGFIRMSRNMNNQCGIATAASFPIMEDQDREEDKE